MTETGDYLVEKKSGQRRALAGGTTILSSAECEWDGIRLTVRRREQFEEEDVAFDRHVVVLQKRGTVDLEVREDGRWQRTVIRPGMVSFYPAGWQFSARLTEPAEFVALWVDPGFASRVLQDGGKESLVPFRGVEDPLIRGVMEAMHEAVRRRTADRAYAEALAGSLVQHLARRGRQQQAPDLPRVQGGLTRSVVRRVVDFMEAHLADDLSLEQLAEVAGLSQFHFARQFKVTLGVAPYAFLRERRLDRARDLLVRGEGTIAEIASRTGFCDQSHLSAHFKRRFGASPRAFVRGLSD